jgi:hypothetical protein
LRQRSIVERLLGKFAFESEGTIYAIRGACQARRAYVKSALGATLPRCCRQHVVATRVSPTRARSSSASRAARSAWPTSSTVSAYAATFASAEARFAWSRFSCHRDDLQPAGERRGIIPRRVMRFGQARRRDGSHPQRRLRGTRRSPLRASRSAPRRARSGWSAHTHRARPRAERRPAARAPPRWLVRRRPVRRPAEPTDTGNRLPA